MSQESDRKKTQSLIASNPSAYANYQILEVVEAGLVLTGTEVKSLRAHSPQIREAFVSIDQSGPQRRLEAWLVQMNIAPYSHGNRWNHGADRKRKLLLNRKQVTQLFAAIQQQGMTVIPTRLYFRKGWVKVELGLGKGKKNFDKREDLKKKVADREIKRVFKQSGAPKSPK